MSLDLRELVSRQLHLPSQFIRVESDAASKNNRVVVLTTFEWLVSIQSQARLSSHSGAGEDNDRYFGQISDADRTRFLAPSTESLPAPWIRVRVVVELKTDSNFTYLPERDGTRSPDSSVIPPQRRFSALHDKDGRCVEPKHLNLSAFLSHSFYENSWQSIGDFEGGDDGQNRRRKAHLHQRRSSRRDAILYTLDALYEASSSSSSSSRVDEMLLGDQDKNASSSSSSTMNRLQVTTGHANVASCICVLDSPDAVFILQPYAPHSLFHVMTYTQSAMADNFAKSLFIAYQLLRAMDFCQARGIFIGELKLSEVEVDEKLWIRIFPRSLEESFIPLNEESREKDSEDGKHKIATGADPPLKELTRDWVHGRLSNFDYLMALNKLAGRVPGDPNNHPILPWVVDFSAPDAYRDLTKSKYRLNKGDHQLDLMFESQQQQIPVSHVDIGGGGGGGSGGSSSMQDFPRTPHHISDMLSDITYYVYCARRVDKATLCAHVRSHWVPHEYPSSMRRMFFWTPDECIPEFFTDASIFTSIHEDLPDLETPAWAKSPEDFVDKHRRILEGQHVSKNLHRWIDLTFGYMLTGPAAVANKNVCLQLVDGHEEFTAHGVVQLFTHPHPQKLDPSAVKRPSYLETMAWRELEIVDESVQSGVSSVEAHVNNPLSEAAADESSSDKKTSKSPKEDTLKKQQQKWASKKITLPAGFNPVARLEAVEALHQFMTKNLHAIDSSPKADIKKSGRCYEDHSAFIRQMTKRDVKAFAVVIAELFLAKRLRFQIGDFGRSLDERAKVIRVAVQERYQDIPRPFRRIIRMALGLAKEEADFFGLSLSPDLLMHPSVDLIPFPSSFPLLYSFLSEMTSLTEKMRQRREQLSLLHQQHPEFSQASSRADVKSIACQKVDLCCKTLPQLLPKLSTECLEIVLPHLKELLEDAETAVAAAWHLFSVIAMCFGPEKTIQHFLASLIKLFQQDEKTTTSKHMKLYHRTFILQLMVGFGLSTFLYSFSTLMVEATAGFKNFVDEDCVERVSSNDAFVELVTDDDENDDDGRSHETHDSLELTRSSDGEGSGVTFDIHTEQSHPFERSRGGDSSSFTSVSDVFDGGRMGPILEADLASLEGELSNSQIESDEEDRERDRDSLTIVENAIEGGRNSEDDDESEKGGDDIAELGSSVHSLSRLAHYNPDKGDRRGMRISDASSVTSGEGVVNGGINAEPVTASSQQRPPSATTGGRSSGLSSDQCNIADVSSETIKWLASRLGPVLTTKYLSGNLLKMLSLCYLGVEQMQPTPVDSGVCDVGSDHPGTGSNNAALNYAVKGDSNARHVLDAISTIAIYYGEQIILLHYFPYLAELIASSAKKRRLHVRAEAGLVSAMVLLRHCLPLLGDQTLMDYLPDVVFKDILEKLIGLISNAKIGFPSGALARSVICYKIIDVMVMVSLRIGFEMTRKMMTTLLKRFFACFDVVHAAGEATSNLGVGNEEEMNKSMPRTSSVEASMYVELKKDPVTDELVAGKPFQLKIKSPTLPESPETTEMKSAHVTKHVRSASLYSLSALAMEPREGEEDEEEEDEETTTEKEKDSSSPSSGADMDSPSEDEERNRAELKQVFTSALAHSVYVPFCKLAGNIHLDQTLSNKDLIHSLVAKVEVLLLAASESGFSNGDDIGVKDGRNVQTGSVSHSTVSGNFGKDVAVSGNRINIAGGNEVGADGANSPTVSTASPSQVLSPSRIPLSPDLEARALIDLSTVDLSQLKSLEMQNNTRHLKGNWLQYWEHEQGLSPQDANSFEFKGIRLQSFVGHSGAVRSLRVLDNENSFLSASKDKTVKLWSIKNSGDGLGRAHPRWTYTHHKKSVFSVIFVNSLRLVASCDSTVHLWDPFVGAVVHHYDAAKIAPVSVLASIPSPSSTLVAATTENHNALKLLDCRQPGASSLTSPALSELRLTPSSGAGLIRCVAVSPDGAWVACGFSSGMLCVVDLRTGMIIGMWKAHEGEIYKVETFNASTIVTASFDQTIQVWDVLGKKRFSYLRGHLEPAHCLGFFKSAVISATTANRIGVHSNVTPEATFTVSKLHTDVFKGVLTTMSVLSLNRLLLFGADNGSIKLCC